MTVDSHQTEDFRQQQIDRKKRIEAEEQAKKNAEDASRRKQIQWQIEQAQTRKQKESEREARLKIAHEIFRDFDSMVSDALGTLGEIIFGHSWFGCTSNRIERHIPWDSVNPDQLSWIVFSKHGRKWAEKKDGRQ